MQIETQKVPGVNKKIIRTAIIVLVIVVFFVIAYFYNRRVPDNQVQKTPEAPVAQEVGATTTESSGFEPVAGSEPLPETDLPFDGETATTTPPAENVSVVPASPKPALIIPKTITTSPKTTVITTPPAVKADPKVAAARDEQRQTDMRRMAGAQTVWHGDHKKYYTCSTSSGDCRGKTNNFPLSIGSGANNVKDPLGNGLVCGLSYTYCGLDNTRDNSRFCYYAKLETGGYYAVSETGSYKRNSIPSSLADCAKAPVAATAGGALDISKTTPQERDGQRKSDMLKLFTAQSSWYKIWGQYYTCSVDAGNCGGKSGNYPDTLGVAMAATPDDPINSGMICGRDQIYCGLNNTKDSAKFCYYTKLETGGYYTASQSGTFERSSAPGTFIECAQPN